MIIQDIKAMLDKITPRDWEAHLHPKSVSVHGPDFLIYQTLFPVEISETVEMHHQIAQFIAASPHIVKLLVRALEMASEFAGRESLTAAMPQYWLEQAQKEIE